MSTLGASNGSSIAFEDILEQDSSSIHTDSSDALFSSTSVFEPADHAQDLPSHWEGVHTDATTSVQDPTGPVGPSAEEIFPDSAHGLMNPASAPDLSLLVSTFSPPLQDWEGESTDTNSHSPSECEWDAPVVRTMATLSTPELNAPLFPMYDYIDVDVPLPTEKTDSLFMPVGNTSCPLPCL